MVADSLWSCGIDMACILPERGAVAANTLGGVKGFNFGRDDGMDALKQKMGQNHITTSIYPIPCFSVK